MTRRVKLVTALVLILLGGGLGGWAWYLSGRSLQEADNASSVLGGVAAVVFGVIGVVLGMAALRQTKQAAQGQAAGGNGSVIGDRAVSVAGGVRGHVITGDHTTITGWSPRAAWVMVLAASASVASVVVALRGDGPPQPEPVRIGACTAVRSGVTRSSCRVSCGCVDRPTASRNRHQSHRLQLCSRRQSTLL